MRIEIDVEHKDIIAINITKDKFETNLNILSAIDDAVEQFKLTIINQIMKEIKNA